MITFERIMIRAFLPFLCGITLSNNLSILIPVNAAYEAAWWKVGLCLLIVLALAFLAAKEKP